MIHWSKGMDSRKKQLAFKNICDSGYNSLEIDDENLKTVEDSAKSEKEESFSDWLKKVAKCLGSRPKADYYRNRGEINNNIDEDEASRCMRIVKSVLDEKTVLDMTRDYLHYAKVLKTIPNNH